MKRVFLGLMVVALLLVSGRHFLNLPVRPESQETKMVEIPEGAGVREVARRLRDHGVVRSPTGFVVLAYLRGKRGSIRAGTYTVSPKESGGVLLARLVRGDAVPGDIAVTIPEGFTLRQIAERLAARGVVGQEAFVAAARADAFRSSHAFLRDVPPDAALEGYLFPDTYRFAKDTAADTVLRRMLKRFEEQWEEALRVSEASGSASEPVSRTLLPTPFPSVHELVTMASIVEREVRSGDDRRLVAGILWSRLRAGIGLEADATVRYALNNWERPLTVRDLRTDSPYNTRRYQGLPPGPIGNPGLESMRATLEPTDSDFLYYLSASDGKTIFSRTLDEHNSAKATHLR